MRKYWLFLVGLFLPLLASAHGVGQVYVLPIPLKYYLSAAGLAVAFSFFLFAFFFRSAEDKTEQIKTFSTPRLPQVLWLLKLFSLLFIMLAIFAGNLGVQNPNQNFAPIFFWVFFLIGFGLLSMIIGNIWDNLNPWKNLFELLMPPPHKDSQKKIPPFVGVILLWGLFWLELASGVSFSPQVIGLTLLVYTAVNLIMPYIFSNWFEDGEVFSVLFGFIGRLAYLKIGQDDRSLIFLPLSLRLKNTANSWAHLGVAAVLLAGTSFDSLKETVTWFNLLRSFGYSGVSLVGPSTFGLLLSPLPFLFLYFIVIWIMGKLTGQQAWRNLAKLFVWSLVPVAYGYTLAHNFSLVLVTAPQMLGLISDPFGFGWNLFGTGNLTGVIVILGAKAVWFVEIGFVVAAHIVGTLYAHILAVNNFSNPRTVMKSQYPMLILMVAFTVTTLWLLAQPLVVGR
jgi:hypothetical protein